MRTRRQRGSTKREAVVSAALAIADQDGLAGLTIRAVADRVGAPTMSLYTHFRNKNELLDLMLMEIAARIYICERHPTWQAEMLALCRRVYHLLSEHPKWIPLLSRPVWPVELPLREHMLKLMVDDGIAAADGLMAVGDSWCAVAFVGATGAMPELAVAARNARNSCTNFVSRGESGPSSRSSTGTPKAVPKYVTTRDHQHHGSTLLVSTWRYPSA
jgi:AcrR family transcriptional regulator